MTDTKPRTAVNEVRRILDRPMLSCGSVSSEAWAERWGLRPFSASCYVCGTLLTTSIPFAAGHLRGLVAPACPKCGDTLTPFCVVGADSDLLEVLADD